jgi:cytochrome c oxidase assembly protein Cox11
MHIAKTRHVFGTKVVYHLIILTSIVSFHFFLLPLINIYCREMNIGKVMSSSSCQNL